MESNQRKNLKKEEISLSPNTKTPMFHAFIKGNLCSLTGESGMDER